MKKSLTVILVIVMMINSVQQVSVARASSYSRLEQLLAQGEVPQYVKTTGRFYFNPEFEEHDGLVPTGIVVPTTNVNLRAEPNANSEKLGLISPENPSQWPTYLGEWTTPEGRRWVLGEFTVDDGKIHDANNPARTIPVWIFGKYTELMDEEMYSMVLDGAAEAELEVSDGNSYSTSYSESHENNEVMAADQLLAEFQANEARLRYKFGGKTVTVKGCVEKVYVQGYFSLTKERSVPCIEFYIESKRMFCFFPPTSKEYLLIYGDGVNAGDVVTVQGTLHLFSGRIELTDCRILAR